MKPTSIRLRSGTLDTIRGLTLVSMIVYHACWDLVYLYRLDWGWYRSFWAGIWQQSTAVRLFSSPASAGRWGAILCAGG